MGYSAHFSERELDCRCGCETPAAIAANLGKLAAVLEDLRKLAGQPITILSGYRCRVHNARVGGAEGSQHMMGLAADITCKGLTIARLRQLAERVPSLKAGGIGTYRTWVHVDIRANGPARWRG